MPNPLTGDFEAVLQVSGSTINRLLASLHQNAFEKPNLPSFPHSVRMRIGDDHAYEGVRGVVHAQVAVPRVELIHGVTDRFMLEVGVRAWYRPDPGTEPMPAFIHGTVRAEYRVHDIDPSCLGWSRNAADFLWIRVVRDSVRFQGTAEDDGSILGLAVAGASSDPAANIAKITKQVARLLARRFEATPHPVSKRFRRGSLRSLNAPIGGSAVALPIGLNGEPSGLIHSIDNVLLNGANLAVAVNINYIMSLTAPMLDAVKSFNQTVWIHIATGKYNPIPDFDTVYRVGVHPPTVGWEPHGSYALFKLNVSGWANTDSIAPNATFDITQTITLDFNAGDGRLRLTPWTPIVHAHASGLAGGLVEGTVQNEVLKAVPPIVLAACNSAQPALDMMTTRIQELSQQLRTLDDQASAWLDSAEFVIHGMVLRGTIALAPRRRIVVKHEKTLAQDAHSALESWMPGGRIDRFEWSWTWGGSGDPGTATHHDRFLLRRPWGRMSRWGVAASLRTPVPGLDGSGTVCLRITGAQVDPVTGQFVTVVSTKRCTRFGLTIADVVTQGGRLFLRDMPELSKDVPFPQLSDLPLVAPRRGEVGSANTLLVYVDEAWDSETADTLAAGLEACGRYDAGLAVLVLFREGVLDARGPRLIADVEEHLRKLGIAGHVNEDVSGNWSRALELRAGPEEPAWGIITPEGYPVWTHQGHIDPQHLATALDTHLRRSPDVRPVAFHPGIEVGAAISATALHPGFADLVDDLAESHCPPLPLGRLGIGSTVVTFVQKHSAASAIHLRQLAGRYGQQEGEGAAVVFVLDGADQREAESLKNSLGLDFIAVADPTGKITDRFAVGMWPTTLTLNSAGIVSDVQLGVAERHDDEHPRPDEDPHCCCTAN